MEVCAFGYYEVETSFTWDTLPYATWDEWAWDKWDTREGLEGAPHELCADYSGYTHRMFASEEDNDAEYTGSFVIATDFSKDKKSFLLKKRVSWFQVIFRNEGAGTVSLYVKRDFETSWQSIGTVSLDGNEDILILDVNYDILAKSVQFKFEATNTFRFLGMIFPEIDEIGVR